VEISRRDLLALAAGRVREVRPLVEQYEIQGRRLNLLARGRVVNLAAAEGHPASVMDLSFAVHALVVEDVVARDEPLAAGVHAVPAEIDRAVASLKLTSLGVGIDRLSPDQQEYLRSWAPGSNGG
jgi:adenosylhomocysteinase